MNAGPRNGQSAPKPAARPSSERRAARATAASPGRTSSTPRPSAVGGAAAAEPRRSCRIARFMAPPAGSTRIFSASSPPEGVLFARRPRRRRPAERLRVGDPQIARRGGSRARRDSAASSGRSRRRARRSQGLPGSRLGERGRVGRRRWRARRRDRVAVGVERGVPELVRDQPLEVLGDVVLENLGLVVDAVPGHSQGVREEGLDQPVVADHLQRHPLARRGQA